MEIQTGVAIERLHNKFRWNYNFNQNNDKKLGKKYGFFVAKNIEHYEYSTYISLASIVAAAIG